MPVHEELVMKHLKSMEGVPDSILPSYDGFGIANIIPSVSAWLGGKSLAAAALDESISNHFAKNYKQVLVILVDALGYKQLRRWIADGHLPFWQTQIEAGHLFPLTSICPSTTASALTSIWTGSTPSQHGVIGYEMWLWQLGMSINNIFHMPAFFEGDMGGLSRGGFNPQAFLGIDPIGTHFKKWGIDTHAVMPSHIIGSGLSRMHLNDATFHGYSSESDMWMKVCQLLINPNPRRQFVYAYWSVVDTLSHRYGTYAEVGLDSFTNFSNSFERLLIEKVNKRKPGDTLVLLTADHGSVTTPVDENYNLVNHPELRKMLVMPPTCEARLPFLYTKNGQDETVRDYFEKTWPGKFKLINREQALQMELFGKGAPNPDLDNRIGDLVAVVTDPEAYLWWPNKLNHMAGRHGGLHEDEMLVPLLGFEL
jgi:hypothetical protein